MTNTTRRTARTAARAITVAAQQTTGKTEARAILEERQQTLKKATAPKRTNGGDTLYKIHSLDAVEVDTRTRQVAKLSRDDARKLTEEIQRTSVRLWLLVTEAHDRKAHLALGYETWADYVKAELNMSESRSYQFLDTGHVMKALASAGVDIEKTPPPPTRVVARVKDRLTDVKKAAEKAMQADPKDQEKAIDKAVRALAREPRKPGKHRKGSTPPATEPLVAATHDVETVQCPACKGKGKVPKDQAAKLRELISKIKSS